MIELQQESTSNLRGTYVNKKIDGGPPQYFTMGWEHDDPWMGGWKKCPKLLIHQIIQHSNKCINNILMNPLSLV